MSLSYQPLCLAGLVVAVFISGCTGSAISTQARDVNLPDRWQYQQNRQAISSSWLADFAGEQLTPLISEAIDNNYQFGEQQAQLEAAYQAAIITGADRWPALSLNLDGSRRSTALIDNEQTISESYEASLNLSWELDIWGKLSDSQKQAQLTYQANVAALASTRQRLTASTATAWFEVIQAQQLLDLLTQRLDNVQQNLDIIQRGYQQGINEALDVYLSQDTLHQQRANTANQQQVLTEAISNLQRLLARYPDGQWQIDAQLPVVDGVLPAGQPSELLMRRPDIQQAWLELLAADAGLAVAHKQRFPSLTLAAAGGDSSSELHQLLDGGPLVWSLLGGLSQPLFAGHRLQAGEAQARARVAEAEQHYLDVVHSAFAEVENALSRADILQQRYLALLDSKASSNAAYRLSFQQYKRGLVSYTTVLEAQRRAFDAQTNVIQLRFQRLSNRIALHLALGGGFSHE